MGKTSGTGSFGIGLQAVKGTPIGVNAAAMHYLPVLSVDLAPDQMAATLPPEIGGSPWPMGSYKGGISAAGTVTLNARASSIGWLLHAFAGSATSAADGDSYKHSFFQNQSDTSLLPWCTLVKNVSDTWYERYYDAKVDSLRIDIPTAGLVTCTVGFVAAKMNSDDSDFPAETYDSSPVFETTSGSVKFGGDATKKVTRLTLDFANGLSRDERLIGSYYLDDITMLRRTLRITADCFVDSAAWYQQVYNGAAGADAWSPTIVSTDLDVKINTGGHITGSTHGYLRIVVPNIDFMAYPVAMAGQDLLRATLTADLTLISGSQPFYIETKSQEDNYNLNT